MIETLKMWVFGLPYALWETQRVKVAVQRFWEAKDCNHYLPHDYVVDLARAYPECFNFDSIRWN
jgi:hypothetical protein